MVVLRREHRRSAFKIPRIKCLFLDAIKSLAGNSNRSIFRSDFVGKRFSTVKNLL